MWSRTLAKVQDGGDPPSWKSTWLFFSADLALSDLDKISQTVAECHVDFGDMVKIETRSRIPIWRTFGRIQCHARATYHIAGCCHLVNRATCHISGCCHLANLLLWSQFHVPHRSMAKSMSRSWHIYEFHPPYWKSFFAIFYFIFVF